LINLFMISNFGFLDPIEEEVLRDLRLVCGNQMPSAVHRCEIKSF